jgi:hypothetical protein
MDGAEQQSSGCAIKIEDTTPQKKVKLAQVVAKAGTQKHQ